MIKTKFLWILFVFLWLIGGISIVFGQVKVGGNSETISPFSILELESTDKGFMLPRMTSSQRDAAFDQVPHLG